jgi:YggT family protein
MFGIIGWLLELYLLLLIARALLSWFQGTGGAALQGINRFLYQVTEPVLRPIRSVIKPVRVGGTYIDLSILIVFIVIQMILIPLFR